MAVPKCSAATKMAAVSKWAVLAIVVANVGTSSAGSSLFNGQVLLMNNPVAERQDSGATLLLLPAHQGMQPVSLLQSLGRSLLASPRNIKTSTSTKNVVNKEFSSNFEESCVNGVCTSNKQSSGDPNMGDMNMGGMDMMGDTDMGGFDSDFFKGSSMFDQVKKPTKKTTTKKKAGRSPSTSTKTVVNKEFSSNFEESCVNGVCTTNKQSSGDPDMGDMNMGSMDMMGGFDSDFFKGSSMFDQMKKLTKKTTTKKKAGRSDNNVMLLAADPDAMDESQLMEELLNMVAENTQTAKQGRMLCRDKNGRKRACPGSPWDRRPIKRPSGSVKIIKNKPRPKPKFLVVPVDQLLRGRANMFGDDPSFN